MNDCTGSRPACILDGSCLLDVSLRRILRAVDRTLPCGSGPFSADCLDFGRRMPISCWSYAISSFPSPFNAEECMSSIFFSTWACWNSARSCRSKNNVSLKAESGKIDASMKSLLRHNAAMSLYPGSRELSPDGSRRSCLVRIRNHRKPRILANICTNAECRPILCWWTESLPAIGHQVWHSATNDDKRLECRPIRVWLVSIRRRVRTSSLPCDWVDPRSSFMVAALLFAERIHRSLSH
jgi:hypothetical protein